MSVYIKSQTLEETNSTYKSLLLSPYNSAIPGYNQLNYYITFRTTVSYWASGLTRITFIYDNQEYSPGTQGFAGDDELDLVFRGTLPNNIVDLNNLYVRIKIVLAEDLDAGVTNYQTASFKLVVNNKPAYFAPKIYMRPNPDATLQYNALNINFWGIGYNDSFGTTNNTFTFQYRYKLATASSWGSWTNISSSSVTWNGNNYSGAFSIAAINSANSDKYTVEIKVTDKLTSANDGSDGMTNDAMFSWSPNSFDFNVPVNIHTSLAMGPGAGFTMDGDTVLYNQYGTFAVGTSSNATTINGSSISLNADTVTIDGNDIASIIEELQYITTIKNLFSTTYQLTVPGIVNSSASATAYLRGNNLIVQTTGGAAGGSVQIRHYGKIQPPDIRLEPYDILNDYIYAISSSGNVYTMRYSSTSGNDIYFDIEGPGTTTDKIVFVYPVALNLDASW